MARLFAVCLTISLLALSANAQTYSYSNQTAWNTLQGSFCGGSRQSPVNIVTNNVQFNSTMTPLRMNANWNAQTTGKWSNNGHTLKFTPNTGTPAATTENFLSTYTVLQFHFHWGPNNSVGSENTINGRYYAGELHFVHYNAARPTSSQYAVVAVFLESDANMDISGTIWETLSERPDFNRSTTISNIIYNQMLPSNLEYYYFPGSLTTPNCNEVVEWFVLKTPISVPAEFLENLRTVEDSQGMNLTLNYREVQPLNGRIVMSAGFTPFVTFALLALTLIIASIANY